jgi:hypothetical protein
MERVGSGGGVAWVSLVTCIGWAVASATLLHSLSDRTGAASFAWIGWGWGLTAMLTARNPPRVMLIPSTIVIVAIVFRLLFIGTPPWLSDDVYRYLFEGQAFFEGHNPYVTPPTAIDGMNDALRGRVNHSEIPTIYPPVALALFQVLARLGGAVWTAQLAAATADMAVVAALLRAGPQVRSFALLYAVHPLPILESASSAHLEPFAIALLAWACLSPRLGPALTLLGAGLKVFPALILPFAIVRGRSAFAWLSLIAALLAILLVSGPFLQAGTGAGTAATNYARHWSFNGLTWPVLTSVLTPLHARLLIAVFFVAIYGVALWRCWAHPIALWCAVGGAFLALTPTAHPWYALWFVVPAGWLGLSVAGWTATSVLGSYAVLSTFDAVSGAWAETPWLWAVTWLLILVATAWELRRRSRAPAMPTTA